jgi:hypothetical protein
MPTPVPELAETVEHGDLGMPTVADVRLHPTQTTSGRRYQFTPKHHGYGGDDASRWLEALSLDDEFAIFHTADAMNIADTAGNLFGAMREGQNSLRRLGTFNQQIAKFPCVSGDQAWHGYPVWALDGDAPPKLRAEKQRPPKEVFDRMLETDLIDAKMQFRLKKGEHV